MRVVVLTANTHGQPKPVFCAGYDIGGFDEEGQGATSFERVPEALAVLRPITICALNGSVYGGATDIVLACDLRIGLQGIEWRMPATAIGLHYYPSGLARYIQRMGLAATKKSINEIATGVAQEATLRERVERTSLSEDFAEGRAAFAERRQPVFRGK